MYGSEAWTITKALAQRLDAFETGSHRKILRIPYTRHATNASVRETTGCPQFQVSLKQVSSASLAMWLIQIPGKIITKLLMRRFDHQETGGDLDGARVPPGWGGLIMMYSRQTSVSAQLGGRPTIVFSGDVSSTWQHCIRGTPLKNKVPKDDQNRRTVLTLTLT